MKYGRWTVLEKSSKYHLLCICDCGTRKVISKYHLLDGKTKSCGCLFSELLSKRNYKHGKSNTSTYMCWCAIRNRCYRKTATGYKNYGGRGIKVCYRWMTFKNFLKDMGEKPIGLSIERIDNNKNYSPENCRWATRQEQNNNSRQNVWITYNGEKLTMTQWSKRLNINLTTLRSRLTTLNWTVEEALAQKS